MTNKFNVGDKVKVIANKYGSQNLVGDIGIVTEINGKSIAVKVKGRPDRCNWHNESELKTVESKPTKNQRITKLEQEVAELKLIVAQIRKPSTVVEEALANDIIEFEGKQYKKVDREAREGDVVVFNDDGGVITEIVVGKPYPVNETVDGQVAYWDGNTRLCANFYIYAFGRTKDNVDVYELIVEDKPNFNNYKPMRYIGKIETAKPKTANQLRAEIIEKAKAFVERNSQGIHYDVPVIVNNLKTFITLAVHFGASDELEFVINNEKRTVVALIRTVTGKRLFHRGIAKCDPSDVFNEHIGKAIALGRALGLDVSEFEQAVQPNELVVGMVAERMHYLKEKPLGRVTIEKIEPYKGNYNHLYPHNEFTLNNYDGFGFGNGDKIINDTNAQYEVNK